jgi:small GTP-binding protein
MVYGVSVRQNLCNSAAVARKSPASGEFFRGLCDQMEGSSTPSVKAVLIGNKSVGKTCIFKRLQDDTFTPDQPSTIGGSYFRLSAPTPSGSTIAIGLWDTAGAEQYRAIVPMYFQRARIIICVFDLTSQESFDNINEWVALARNKAPANVTFLLVGNKSDLESDRQVRSDAAQQLHESIGATVYVETSARTGTGIDILRSQLGTIAATENEEVNHIEPVVTDDEAAQERRPSGCDRSC